MDRLGLVVKAISRARERVELSGGLNGDRYEQLKGLPINEAVNILAKEILDTAANDIAVRIKGASVPENERISNMAGSITQKKG